MSLADSGVEYVWAWPKGYASPTVLEEEAAYWLDRIPWSAAQDVPRRASKALKWGASPEQVAQALAAVAS